MADDVGAGRVALATGVIVKGWGESVSVVYSAATASTHLVSADAADLLLAIGPSSEGLGVGALAVPGDLIEALVQTGLLRRAG